MHESAPHHGGCLDRLIERIGALEERGTRWHLAAGQVRELLGVGHELFLRTIYAAAQAGHPLIGVSAAMERYSQENIWEFVALVELFCGPAAERCLQEAGVFFSHPEQLEIMGVFLQVVAEAVGAHQLRQQEFSAMLAAFGGYEKARACYLQEHFPLPELVAGAARRYCDSRRFILPELARRNAEGLIRYFFQKHVLEPGNLFPRLEELLLLQAAAEGYAHARQAEGAGRGGASGEASEEADEGSAEALAGRPSRLEKARRTMELERGALSLAALKSQYKRLMKRYHPDLNPRGLKRCQEINAAYALLLSSGGLPGGPRA